MTSQVLVTHGFQFTLIVQLFNKPIQWKKTIFSSKNVINIKIKLKHHKIGKKQKGFDIESTFNMANILAQIVCLIYQKINMGTHGCFSVINPFRTKFTDISTKSE